MISGYSFEFRFSNYLINDVMVAKSYILRWMREMVMFAYDLCTDIIVFTKFSKYDIVLNN